MIKDQYGNEAQFKDGDTFKIYGNVVEVVGDQVVYDDGSCLNAHSESMDRHVRVGSVTEYKSKIKFKHGDRYKINEHDRFVGEDLSSYDGDGDVCLGYPANELGMGSRVQNSYVPADPNKIYDEFGREVSGVRGTGPDRIDEQPLFHAKDQAMHRRAQAAESRASSAERSLKNIRAELGQDPVSKFRAMERELEQYRAENRIKTIGRPVLERLIRDRARKDPSFVKEILDA